MSFHGRVHFLKHICFCLLYFFKFFFSFGLVCQLPPLNLTGVKTEKCWMRETDKTTTLDTNEIENGVSNQNHASVLWPFYILERPERQRLRNPPSFGRLTNIGAPPAFSHPLARGPEFSGVTRCQSSIDVLQQLRDPQGLSECRE